MRVSSRYTIKKIYRDAPSPITYRAGKFRQICISNCLKQLLEQYHEGLICLSACLAGEIPQAILAGDYERAKATALWYRDLFGAENYYIELQDHGLKEDTTVLPQLIKLARETGIPMAATNDSHYLRKEDAKMQAILLCIQTGKTIQDADRMEFQTCLLYTSDAADD